MERVMPVDSATLISWRGLSVWMEIMRILLFALVRRSACYNVDTEKPLIFVGKSESYFGTTAEIVIDSQKWILVGAIKDNFTDKPEIPFPGNVYACPVDFLNSTSNCTVLPNLRTSETFANESAGVFEESDQMLGASIIVPEDSAKPIKICAPKWKNLRFFRPDTDGDNTYQVTGNCFVLNNRSDLINTAVTLGFRIPKDDFDYYKAPLIGFSTADTKIRVFDTLFGAPNIGRFSTGGLLAKNDGNIRNAKSMKLEVERSKVVQNTYLTGSLFGYSIAPGNLGGVPQTQINFHFVVGAPGFSNKNGVIGAFSVLQFGTAFQQVKQIEGMQVGGGFGQTLCIADVNGDKNDEILVAAPNWFSMGDQGNKVIYDVGVVYVYYGTGSSSIIDDTAQEIHGSSVRFSRFGTAISNIGDINKDGYNDIAIGAPFENKEGAIYIFNGGKTRLEDKYSQKIIGSNLKPGLQGFGWYISRTARDLDDNMYNDFVVGAYRSDTAVLLRTRNIIDVYCEISYAPNPIPLNSSGTFCNVDFNPCFNVSVCFNFTGEGINKTNIDFTITIDANETRKRAAMTNGSHRFEELTVRDFTIFSFKSSCYFSELTVENIDRRFFQVIERPVSLRVDYNISNVTVDPGTVKAILRRGISASFLGQARFDTDCTGSGGVCLSDLKLDVSLDKGLVLIGNDSILQMKVSLKNYGEPSLKSLLRINYPSAVRSSLIDVKPPLDMSCLARNNGSSIECESETTLYQRMLIEIDIVFEISKASMEMDVGYISTQSLVFNVTAITANDTNINDNTVIKNVDVSAFTRTTLQVSASDEQITAAQSSIQFSNTYRLFNEGPCVIEKVDLQFFIPVRTQSKIFIKKGDVKVQSKNSKDSCKLEYYPSKESGTTTQNPVPQSSTIRYNTSGTNVIPLDSPTGRDVHDHPVQEMSENAEYIFCDKRVGPYMCAVVKCTLSLVKPVDRDNRTLVISFDIAVDELPELQKGKSFFTFVTRGHVFPSEQSTVPLVLKEDISQEVSVSILFPDSFTQEVEELDLSILIGGCVGGLVLFILLGLILWKCGFFKRKKRKQVEEYKRRTRYSMRKSRMASVRSARSGAGSIRSKVPEEEQKLNKRFDDMDDANFTT